MDILVAIKRVPMVGGRILLRSDGRAIDTDMLGFTVSPHEECAVEEAVRIVEQHGGAATVASLGRAEAAEQLRDAIAVGASDAVLIETDLDEVGPIATAAALVEVIGRLEDERKSTHGLVLFGNEAADTGDYQVAVRVAHALGRPCATGIKHLEVSEDTARASRSYRGVEETYVLPLPAVVSVKEGINLPRYPSLPGRMRAKKAVVRTESTRPRPDALTMQRLRLPSLERRSAEVLGEGIEAVPSLVATLERIGVVS